LSESWKLQFEENHLLPKIFLYHLQPNSEMQGYAHKAKVKINKQNNNNNSLFSLEKRKLNVLKHTTSSSSPSDLRAGKKTEFSFMR